MKKSEKSAMQDMRPNLYDYLKVLAIVTMIIDHAGYYLFPEFDTLRWIGRFAFPIFLFLVGFNGKYTRNSKLFRSALLLQLVMRIVLFYTGYGSLVLNILFSILLSRVVLAFLSPYLKKQNTIPLIFSCFFFAALHPYLSQVLDYGSLGFFFALGGLIAREYTRYFRVIAFAFLGLLINTQAVFRFGDGSFLNQEVFGLLVGFSFLTFLFYLLHKRNYPLKTGTFRDQIILWISRYALWIYVGHILLFLLCITAFLTTDIRLLFLK